MKEQILYLIPTNRYITRQELIELTGCSDRMIRRTISDLKKEHTIISLSSGKGYRKVNHTDNMTNLEMIQEYEIVKHCIAEINSRKKVYNMQLRQYIAYLKVLEKTIDKQ